MQIRNILLGILLMGCGSIHKDPGMVTSATAVAEPHVVWTRPLEVGFEMGRYIEGSSSTRYLFGCLRLNGDAVRQESRVPMMGESSDLSNQAKLAVAKAVGDNNADGMYILRVDQQVTWSGLVKESTTTVHGRALKLEDFGSVDQERATRVRIETGSSSPNAGKE